MSRAALAQESGVLMPWLSSASPTRMLARLRCEQATIKRFETPEEALLSNILLFNDGR